MVAALAALALGQFLGILWTVSKQEPAKTPEPHIEDTAIWVTGTVIRREQVIYADTVADWRCRLSAGQRAAAGQVLFSAGETRSARRLAKNLAAARQSQDLQSVPLPQRRQRLQSAIADYQQGISSDLTLTALLLSESEAGAAFLHDAENALSTTALGAQVLITAPESGVFSQTVDGLEDILTPEHPYIFAADLPKKPVSALALGRLITGDTWYLSVTLPVSPAQGDKLQGVLPGGELCAFRAEDVCTTKNGSICLLSCTENLNSVTEIRKLTVKMSLN